MPARFSAYPTDSAALVRVLDEESSYRIGRASECEIQLDHRSISRFHAELSGSDRLWSLNDTGSKNGLSVEGRLIKRAELAKSTWFMIGDVYCSFEPLDEDASAAFLSGHAARPRDIACAVDAAASQSRRRHADPAGTRHGAAAVPDWSAVSCCTRRKASPCACAQRGVCMSTTSPTSSSPAAPQPSNVRCRPASTWSAATPPIHPWLGTRPSVRLGGIRSLLCVPLTLGSRSTGVLYADSRKPGPPITELDIELVENVTRQAAAAIEAARFEDRIVDALRDAAKIGVPAPVWEDLRPALA